jgi:AcrR family transcriptional regulator
MPRNKRLQDRNEKCNEIIDAARQLFLQQGYDATSMTRLAQAAGIAPNTIYWYFKDKDEVLVAVLNSELTIRMQAYFTHVFVNPIDRLLWVVDQFEVTGKLVSVVHARANSSPTIDTWHQRFHQMTEALSRLEMQNMDIPAEKIDSLMLIWTFSIEGMLVHSLSQQQKYDICQAMLSLK